MMSEIVALHSSQSHGGQWRNLTKSLIKEGLHLRSPDLIGYGQQAQFNGDANGFRFNQEIAHLAQLGMNPLEWRDTLLVGHSYGGALALHIALQHPASVRGLVLYEPVSFHVLPQQHVARAEIIKVADAMGSMSQADACRHFVDYWNVPGYFDRLPEKARQLMVAQQAKVTADFEALLMQSTALNDYGNVDCPVTLFVGDESPQSSRTVAQLLASTLPNVSMHFVPAGHMGPLTHTKQVTPELHQAILSLQA
ncbi:MAG: putative hydrolases or acyltransferases (alpha/beta hydrolase superfamily) [Idiomarinaceae bacterium HL-53]|nr:MAG: putative hydrolases or acyltransferases (alpha/beta hydrolase superfamily) [Idiomarinaceae bacterium HL-53]CUS48572.1 Pimeloyl-ACP methyl ester carboxylesterase [Idiomarinaceae bacterium HL-53]